MKRALSQEMMDCVAFHAIISQDIFEAVWCLTLTRLFFMLIYRVTENSQDNQYNLYNLEAIQADHGINSMDLLTGFKHYLFTKKSGASQITVKNYLADISRFLRWYESTYQQPFSLNYLPENIITLYKNASVLGVNSTPLPQNFDFPPLSERTFKRHLASLKKFFSYLRVTHGFQIDPFSASNTQQTNLPDQWHITAYKNALYSAKASPHTIKNYINDIKQFIYWLETVTHTSVPKDQLMAMITSSTLTQYRDRLINDSGLSAVSINRKLSSLRSYFEWLASHQIIQAGMSVELKNISSQEDGLIPENNIEFLLSLQDNPQNYTHQQQSPPTPKSYSRFAPFRLIQKIFSGANILFDIVVISPLTQQAEKIHFALFKLTGRSIFASFKAAKQSKERAAKTLIDTAITTGIAAETPIITLPGNIPTVKNITKAFYSPMTVATESMSFFKRLQFSLRHRRPNWYIRYHTLPLVHYIHFGILVVYAIGLIAGVYVLSVHDPSYRLPVLAASQIDPPKLLSFSGNLQAEKNVPITAPSTLRFSLYNSKEASGAALLWQEVRNVRPDGYGNFSLTLGQKVPIPANLLSENPNVFLGISIGTQQEMRPREQIATAGLATSSQSVGGLRPITQTHETKNTLLALDSAGNLAVGGTGPTFQATEGIFTLTGQGVLLTTNLGSNGSITLAPDGQGSIDVQGPLINSSERNNLAIAKGSVEVDDTFAVLASSSAVAALTLQQDGTAPFISASGSGTAKFTLDYVGNGFFAGNLAVNGNSLTTSNTTFALFPDNAINLSIGGSSTALTLGATSGSTTVRNNLQVSGNTLLGDSTGDVITLSGKLLPANASVQDIGSSQTAFNNAYLTNVFLTPTATMSGFLRRDNGAISLTNTADSLILGSSSLASALIKLSGTAGQDSFINSGKLGIGTSGTLTDTLHVYGDIRVGTSTTDGCLKRYDGTAIAGTCSSDARFKKNIAPITDILNKLDQITPVTYQMRADEFPQYGFGTGTSYGLIAQDVEKVFPDLVETDANGYKMVKYGPELTMISLAGIRELHSQMQALRSTLGSLPITPSGDVTIAQTTDGDYTVSTEKGTFLTTTAAYLKLWVGTLSAGLISAQKGAFDSLAVATENITIAGTGIRQYITAIVNSQPTITTPTIRTNVITPLASDSEIALDLRNSQLTIRSSHSASASAVATFDNQGNASLSGQLTASGVMAKDASISGTLRAQHIIAGTIDGLDDKLATLAAQQAASSSANQNVVNVYNIYNNASNSGVLASNQLASPSATPVYNPYLTNVTNGSLNTTFADLGSSSAALAYVPNLNTDFATITQGLMVFGSTSLSDVSVAGQLSIGGKLIIADNTINVLGQTLELQPLRQGNLSFMGGLMTIDTHGDVRFGGNADFAKDVTIHGQLAATIIAPIPGNDLVIKLGADTSDRAETAQTLQVKNASNSAVLSVNSLGDLIASGAATLGSLNIVRGAQADTSAVDSVASGSAGVATITAGYTSRTIMSHYVSKDSLIYITPRTKTTLAVPYLARQTAADPANGITASFTVQIPGPVSEDVSFNWWIVN